MSEGTRPAGGDGTDDEIDSRAEAGPVAPAEPGEAGQADTDAPDSYQVPWPENTRVSTWSPERAQLALEFAGAIRKTGSLMQLMGQIAADRIGINATDLNCLNILSFSGQMTAGELARATGLTTASITGVVDRLEQAGFVRRERDVHDRRRVVIHLVMEKAIGTVVPVFGPMMGAWQRMADRYTDDELTLIVGFYGEMEQVIRDHLIRLREGS